MGNSVEKNQERLYIVCAAKTVKGIDYDGNIAEKELLDYQAVRDKETLEYLTNPYAYLEWIDDDTYIFGEITYDKYKYDYDNTVVEELKNNKVEYRYGIFRLTRDKKGNVVPKQEKIIVPAIYTSICQNNSKTVTAYVNDKEMTYFDYEQGKQLLPAKLTQAVPFDTEFEDFAECTIGEDNWGYLPRDMYPLIDINDVKLFTKEEVCALIRHEKKLALLINANNKYVDMTHKSFDKRKKFSN